MEEENIRYGTGGKRLCDECEDLDETERRE
jgi:hypothetical protein